MGRIEGVDRKQRILSYLKAHYSATLAELAEEMGLSKQGTLRHVEALAELGLVAQHVERVSSGPGRPAHVYRLTAAAADRFPQGHRELARELVDFLESDQLERFFEARTARVEAEYAGRLAGLDWDGRVRELARLATEHGHMTEVVERPDGSLALRHCNCPIQDVAARTPHPCSHEQDMYRRLLGGDVARSTWQAEGDSSCTYEIPPGVPEKIVSSLGVEMTDDKGKVSLNG